MGLVGWNIGVDGELVDDAFEDDELVLGRLRPDGKLDGVCASGSFRCALDLQGESGSPAPSAAFLTVADGASVVCLILLETAAASSVAAAVSWATPSAVPVASSLAVSTPPLATFRVSWVAMIFG
jgi:hypothetical protein